MHASTTANSHSRNAMWAMLVLLTFMLFQFCTTKEKTTTVADETSPEFIVDTLTIFDSDTFEESTIIYRAPLSMKWINKNRPISEQIDNSSNAYALDTVTIYDRETGKVLMTRITVIPKDGKGNTD